MRFRHLLILILCIPLAACRSGDDPATPTVAAIPTAASASAPVFEIDGSVNFTRGGVDVALARPIGWESFTTDHGIVIAEEFGTVADKGKLHGLMAYVFVTPLAEFPFPVSDSGEVNRAAQILSGIVADSASTGGARVSSVTGFVWEGYDAAYYLFSDPRTGLCTLVIGLALPDHEVMLTAAVSTPREKTDSIRKAALLLLGSLTLNTQPLGTGDLSVLPETLAFPD